MPKRLIILLSILAAVLAYFLGFSLRSPLKNVLFPLIYRKTAREIVPSVDPLPNTHEILLKSGTNINGELVSDENRVYVVGVFVMP